MPDILPEQSVPPEVEKQSLKAKILEDLSEKLARLESTNTTEKPVIPNYGDLRENETVEAYLENGSAIQLANALYASVRILLEQYENFISHCEDLETLKVLASGLQSTTFDFRKWETYSAAEAEKAKGVNPQLDHADDINNHLTMLTAKNINAKSLLESLKANSDAVQEVRDIIIKSGERIPELKEDVFKSTYANFKAFLNRIGCTLPVVDAIRIIAEYMLSVKIVSDNVTNYYIKDIYSNIFNILSSYFSIVEVGSYYDLDAQPPTPSQYSDNQ